MKAAIRIAAQDFYDHEKCPHRVYLNHHGDPAEKLPLSDFLNLLFERALLHERDVIKDLPHEIPSGTTLEERFESTMRLMEAGVERIYQGVLLHGDNAGIPDVLERVDGRSKFGSYFYKPVDIKSGSGYQDEAKGKLREDYGMQLYHYARLLEAVQGTFPPTGEILNRRKERVVYQLAQFTEVYLQTLPEIKALVAGTNSDAPALVSACEQCQWWGRCEKVLVERDDVTLLPGMGRSIKTKLSAAGVRSFRDIPGFDFGLVKIKGIGEKTIDKLVRAANVAISGKLEVLSRPSLPDPPLKIFFDFEDDPTQELVYLCGLLAEPGIRGLGYHGFACIDEGGEARLWADFQKLCVEIRNQDYAVFHYSPYERTKLNQLEEKYGASEKDALDAFRDRMVDLLSVAKESVVVPARGYGLKKIAPVVGYQYQIADAGGAQAIVWFQEYQKDPDNRELLARILQYNQEDCLALKAVYEWLKAL